MSRRKQIKPRHFDSDVDTAASMLETASAFKDGITANRTRSIDDIDEKEDQNPVRTGSGMEEQYHAGLEYHRHLSQKRFHCTKAENQEDSAPDKTNNNMPKERSHSQDKVQHEEINNMKPCEIAVFEPLTSQEVANVQGNLGSETIRGKEMEASGKGNTSDLSGESGVAEDHSDFESDYDDSGIPLAARTVSEVIEKSRPADEQTNQDSVEQNDEEGKNPDSNVKLETLQNTRVAVAQIVENNFPSAEAVPSLMQTVYSLWQQQIMQCQMLEMLRQNLLKIASDRKIAVPNLTANQLQDIQNAYLNQNARGLHTSLNSDGRPMSPDSFESDLDDDAMGYDDREQCRARNEGVCKVGNSTDGILTGNGSPSTTPEDTLLHVMDKGSKTRDAGTSLDRAQYAAEDPLFRHKCRFCLKVFGSDSALQIHVRSHSGEKPYECEVCDVQFSTRTSLKLHYESHISENSELQRNTPKVPTDREHNDELKAIPQVQPLHSSTKARGNETRLDSAAEQRQSRGTPELPYGERNSKGGEEAFSSKHPQPTHSESKLISHRPQIPESSTTVSQTSPDTDSLANLQARHHLNLMATSSPIGGQVPPMSIPSSQMLMPSPFGSPPFGMPPLPFGMSQSPFFRPSILPRQDEEDSMEEFMEIDKSETSKLEAMVKNIEAKLTDPNQCAICKRVLSCKSALQMHYRIHTGERPFKCKICGRAFTTKGNLKTHMGVHRIKPPMKAMHQCVVCHRQFTNVLVLQQHMQGHASEMPRMFPPSNSNPFLSPPGSVGLMGMPFPGLQFPLPPGMPRIPQFPAGIDLRTISHSMDTAREEDDLTEDERPEPPTAGCESPDNTSQQKRTRDEQMEESNYRLIEKRQRTDYDSDINDSTDDEEVPREDDKSAEHQELQPMASTPEAMSDEAIRWQPSPNSNVRHGRPEENQQLSSLSALEERLKALEGTDRLEIPTQPSFTQKTAGEPFESYTPERTHDRSPFGQNRNIPTTNESDTEAPSFERQQDGDFESRADSTSPGGARPPHQQFPFMDFPRVHPLEFAAMGSRLNTTCDVCFKTFACKSALDIHYRSHTKEKPFKCELCDRAFSTKGNMKQHMLSHSARELQSINFNPSSDDSRDTQSSLGSFSHPYSQTYKDSPPAIPFNKQLLTQSPNQAAKQNPNKPEERSQPDVKREPLVIQPLPTEVNKPVIHVQPLLREQDESMFLKRPNLKHVCQVCQKPFSSSSALQIHMRTHTGERPFRCNVCGKSFTTKGNLKVHMSTHEDRNSFTRRGRRMSVDGLPRFGSPFPSPVPGFPGGLTPKTSPPDFFIPRFPFMGYPPMNGFMPRSNEIPVIQISPQIKMNESANEHSDKSPLKDSFHSNDSDVDRQREVS